VQCVIGRLTVQAQEVQDSSQADLNLIARTPVWRT